MAKVWKVREGIDPTIGGPWLTLPFFDCVQRLGLKKQNFIQKHRKQYPVGPRFGNVKNSGSFTKPSLVVVEVTENEIANSDWQTGFYLSHLSIPEAEKKIL